MTAAILIGRTAGVKRFQTLELRAAVRKRADPCSSGQRTQHRLNRGGDRQLNHALHIIAITRAHPDPPTRSTWLAKSPKAKPKGALRCLKRHLARRFYHLLAEPPADQQQTAEPESIPERELPKVPERPRPQRDIEQISTAPSPMVCIT